MINCSSEELVQMIKVIKNSKDFEMLKYKTQNFPEPGHPEVYSRGDHTLDVSNNAYLIGKAICDEEKIKRVIDQKTEPLTELQTMLVRKLTNINFDKVQLISFCHDMGHTPFGHHAEHFFDRLLKTYGSGFTHYQHSTRVVKTILESNGIEMPDGLGAAIEAHSSTSQNDEIKRTSSIEPHIVRRSDKITYQIQDNSDMERIGLFSEEDKQELKRLYLERSKEYVNDFSLGEEFAERIEAEWAKFFDEFFSLSLEEKKKLVIDDIGTTTINNYVNGKERIESSRKVKILLEEMSKATVRVINRYEAKHEDKANVILMRLWWEIFNNREQYEEKMKRWEGYKWEEQCVYYLCEQGIKDIERMYQELGGRRALNDKEFKDFIIEKLKDPKDKWVRRYSLGTGKGKYEDGYGKVVGTGGYKVDTIKRDAQSR